MLTATSRIAAAFRLWEMYPSQQTANTNPPVHGKNPPLRFAAEADAVMVSVVLVAAGGVTVCGSKLQVTPAGKFEQANDTGWLKPPWGATVKSIVPLCPRATVIALEAEFVDKLKSGTGAWLKLAETAQSAVIEPVV